MRRREFIAVTAALLVSPRRSRAQGTRRRLGYLAIGERLTPTVQNAWLDGLRNHGWIDGRNLIIEYRFAQSQDRLPALAADLIALSPDLLIAAGPESALALKSATARIPIVFVAVWESRGARPRSKPFASRRQHNGFCDLRARRFHRKANRNPSGTCS